MTHECRTTLMQIRVLLSGVIQLYESIGPDLFAKFDEQESERLSQALESMAEGVYWARQKAEGALLHEMDETSHAPSHIRKAMQTHL